MNAAFRFAGLWLSPVLLLGVSLRLYAGAPAAVLLALLVIVAPCLALLRRAPAPGGVPGSGAAALTVLAAALLLAANLALIGDIAHALGAPRWHGVAVAGGCAFALTVWPPASRWSPWLGPGALAVAWLALLVVAHATGLAPAPAWAAVASRPAFRFAAESPWVVSGGTFPAPGTLAFAEPHTLRAVRPDVFGVIVSDSGTPTVREWRPSSGDTITLRPGDRLVYPAGARLIFEAGKRVPGAPPSGAAWASPAAGPPRRLQFLESLGLAVTFIGGGVPLLGLAAPTTRAGAAAGLSLLLAGLGWAEGWAVYAGLAAPDLFLGSPRAESLVLLPTFAPGGAMGRRLGGLVVVVAIVLLAATAGALRERVAAGRDGLPGALALWSAVFAVAVAAGLWARAPWLLLALALGLLASTLGPLAAGPAAPPPARAVACVAGLAGFALAAVGGRLLGGPLAETLARYPALLGAPAAWGALRLAGPRAA